MKTLILMGAVAPRKWRKDNDDSNNRIFDSSRSHRVLVRKQQMISVLSVFDTENAKYRKERDMTIALWILAVVETIRMVCQYKQLKLIEADSESRDKAYEEYIKTLKMTDEEFVERLVNKWCEKHEVDR